jgi:hypothetical protein
MNTGMFIFQVNGVNTDPGNKYLGYGRIRGMTHRPIQETLGFGSTLPDKK